MIDKARIGHDFGAMRRCDDNNEIRFHRSIPRDRYGRFRCLNRSDACCLSFIADGNRGCGENGIEEGLVNSTREGKFTTIAEQAGIIVIVQCPSRKETHVLDRAFTWTRLR